MIFPQKALVHVVPKQVCLHNLCQNRYMHTACGVKTGMFAQFVPKQLCSHNLCQNRYAKYFKYFYFLLSLSAKTTDPQLLKGKAFLLFEFVCQ